MQSREPACVMEKFENLKMRFKLLLIVGLNKNSSKNSSLTYQFSHVHHRQQHPSLSKMAAEFFLGFTSNF
jgi:hypothetical protein